VKSQLHVPRSLPRPRSQPAPSTPITLTPRRTKCSQRAYKILPSRVNERLSQGLSRAGSVELPSSQASNARWTLSTADFPEPRRPFRCPPLSGKQTPLPNRPQTTRTASGWKAPTGRQKTDPQPPPRPKQNRFKNFSFCQQKTICSISGCRPTEERRTNSTTRNRPARPLREIWEPTLTCDLHLGSSHTAAEILTNGLLPKFDPFLIWSLPQFLNTEAYEPRLIRTRLP